ncbi:WXG100 family type VII secretion target [Kineococcus sp. T13]|uniref:WXG100 family type VII secretion target n=1 Tax=Kineococcus vitellinus TaxID=2696565 RepID=UPI0014122FC7|nr:WXG100 family type VII secretion target [Kineococcus vitellinus]NAZ74686.1 WXG100 family type VII secretion target [Kineococcus vitellinus]
MAGLFSTSTDTMRATGDKVATNAESIKTELQGLLAKLSSLEGQWIGDGRTAFKNAESRYTLANNKLNAALTEISNLIKANEARYLSDDSSAQSRLSTSSANLDAPGF